jgi:sarcosine oxidase subunit gamma
MADVTLTRHTPVENIVLHAPDHLVSARPLPPMGRFVFRGATDTARRCESTFGINFPVEINRASVAAGRAALWLGPDEWLLLFPEAEGNTLLQRLSAALLGIPHSLVDVGQRQTAIELRGPYAAALLNAYVLLDLSAAAFPVNAATRTILAKAEIALWRTAADNFQIEVSRSFAPYVAGLLIEASRILPNDLKLY